jgi:hypothetical protein
MRLEILLSFALGLAIHTVARAELKGDEEAIVLADQLVESVGGKALWSKIRSLHVIERSRSLRGDGIVGEFWRDLETPRDRYTLTNKNGLKVEFWWDDRGVWQFIDGEQSEDLPENLHAEVTAYWPGEIYVMYHRLAKEDSTLRLSKNDDNSFTAFDEKFDRRLGTFWMNGDGDLYRWRHDDGTEYIYGPHKQFGEISFPDWGSQVDGSWSFYYVEVEWSIEDPDVSFDPPRN